jgi:hypothetical protein
MKIPSLPFHNVIAELLYGLIIGGECIGHQELYVYDPYTFTLTIPDGALYAQIICVADINSSDKSMVVNYKQFDTVNNPPSPFVGNPLGHLGVVEIKGKKNLENFMVTGIRSGEYHLLKIEYYS